MDRYYWLYKQPDMPVLAIRNPGFARGQAKRPLTALKDTLVGYPGLGKEPEYPSRTEFRLGIVSVGGKQA